MAAECVAALDLAVLGQLKALLSAGVRLQFHLSHFSILTKKTTKLTRGYRQPSYVDKTNAATIKSMLPYAFDTCHFLYLL